MKQYRMHLMLCAGTGCVSNRSLRVREVLAQQLRNHNLQDDIAIDSTGCKGFCARGPVMEVQPDGIFYEGLTEQNVPRLVEEHFLEGRPVEELRFTPPADAPPVPMMSDIGFFSKQRLIVLRNRGLIHPESIDEYIGRDGYAALAKALTTMTPEEIITEVEKSGLRGRGGAGFPTGRKWSLCRKAEGQPKHVVCNGDEGDPGAFMDRSIMEGDPHSVLEGMTIGAYAIGATRGYIYVRSEYPLAVSNLNIALDQSRDLGLLGDNILGSDFCFDVEIVRGAGAFVCGEETALVASMQGEIGNPRQRPPYPAESGLWDQPTNINNVETWANVPVIVERGADWFTSVGTEGSKGTKVFSLVGKVRNNGLVEVPMGATLREIVYDVGGGIPKDRKFKAVQTGGPSGGCIPESQLDLPVDFDKLREVGAMMGSGGLIVMDERTCMVDVAKYFIGFLVEESCGKCTACREGLFQMHSILTRISAGSGREGDIDLLQQLADYIKDSSLCQLGGTAPNPVLSTLRYFRDEYEAHIQQHRCPAGVCNALARFTIDTEACTGCGLCKRNCPTDAIVGEKKQPHNIDADACVSCGVCYEDCPFDAVVVA